MLLHTLHNGLLLTVSSFTEQLKTLGIGASEQQHLPMSWLIVAGMVAVVAGGLLIRQGGRFPETKPAQ
jgi:hypothetical protein